MKFAPRQPMTIRIDNVPESLRARRQWMLWKTIVRHGQPCKVPFTTTDEFAKSNDPKTWSSFDEVVSAHQRGGGFEGVMYVFSADDPFVGIDLDGCRDPDTGQFADWARDIILQFDTYVEMSPSQTGVKLFGIGKSPFGGGRNKKLDDAVVVCDKSPGVEVYDHLRCFAVTGWRLAGVPHDLQPCREQLAALCDRYWPKSKRRPDAASNAPLSVIQRARAYLHKIPPAVSGQGGHNQTFSATCAMVIGFGLDRGQALQLLLEWNKCCDPPWSENELEHKIDSATQQDGWRGHLLATDPLTRPLGSSGSTAVDRANDHAIAHRRREARRAMA